MNRDDLLQLIEALREEAIENDDPDALAEAEAFAILALAWLAATEQAELLLTQPAPDEPLAGDDVDGIGAGLSAVLGTGLAAAVAGGLWRIIRAAYGDARQTALLPTGGDSAPGEPPLPAVPFQAGFSFALVDERAIGWLQDTNLYFIRGHWDDALSARFRALAEQAIREGLSRDNAGLLFARELGPVFGQTLNYWRGTAANAITRAREFGRVSAYEAAGTRVVYATAVRDRRTSEVCDYLHGRPIIVASLIEQRDRLLAVTDPLQVRTIAPWRPVEQVKALVEANGGVIPTEVGSPGYHFHCRTRTVVTKPAGAPDVEVPNVAMLAA